MGGHKDTTTKKAAPVEQYRKQIGRQDSKKGKKEMKELRKAADAKKSAMGVSDVMLMVGTFLAVLTAIYGMLYLYLQKDTPEPV